MIIDQPGEYIRYKICCNRMKVKDVARQLDVSIGTVSNWIHDKSFPDKSHLKELSQLLGVSEHEIRNGRDYDCGRSFFD